MTAGTAALTTAAATLYDATAPAGVDPECDRFCVTNPIGGTANVLVNVAEIHKNGEWFWIPPGASFTFGCRQQAIRKVQAKTATGTVTAYCGIVRA